MADMTNEQAIDLDALERLAKFATPGPWQTGPKGINVKGSVVEVHNDQTYAFDRLIAATTFHGRRRDDMAYIAAANPAAILSLIERLRLAESALRERNESADPLQGAVNWFMEAFGRDLPIDEIQRRLAVGYNRAARLRDAAMNQQPEGGAR